MKYLPYILVFLQVELFAQEIVYISGEPVCAGSPTQLNASSIYDDSSILSYNWDLDYNGYYNDAEGKSIEYTFPLSDTFLIAVQIVTIDEETYTSDPYKVIIDPIPRVDFKVKNVCRGDLIQFVNLSYADNRDLVSYSWDFDGDDVSDSHDRDTQFTLDNLISDIKLTVESEDGCVNAITKEIRLYEKPMCDFEFVNSCKKDTVSFNNLSTISGDTILYSVWNFGDQQLSISENAVHAYLAAGTFDVKLINITANNCVDSVSKSIEIFELPEVEILASDTVIFPKKEQSLTVETNTNAITWSTGSEELTISIFSDGVYSVSVEDLNQCRNTDTITIHKLSLNEKVIKSEILTPNGDGINDMLEIKEIFRHSACQVFIYNEWGTQVYNSNDYQNDWNCKYNGKSLATGAYYYLIKFDGHSFRGCVNILR